jgi:hypothetical protein
VARPGDGPRARHYTVTSRARRAALWRRYWVLGATGVAAVLLLLVGGTLLSHADDSPDDRPIVLRGWTERLWQPQRSSQVATPLARGPVPPSATPLPGAARPAPGGAPQAGAAALLAAASPTASRVMPTATLALGMTASDRAAIGPLPPTSQSPAQPSASGAPSTSALEAVALPPPLTKTVTPVLFASVPSFGITAAPTPKPPAPPSPSPFPSSTRVPTATLTLAPLPSPNTRSAAAVAMPSPTPTQQPSPTATQAPPTPTAVPATPVPPRDYKLGDQLAITQVLKGFAFTGHWPGSPEGIYATDWYPRSATESCANSHRMPLAMPVGGTWKLTSEPSPLGGSAYTLIGELDDGNSVAFTHVDRDVVTGHQAANTVLGFVGVSGLEQFDAMGLNPSHAHTAWNDRVVPGWNGDMGDRPARDFFGQYGFQVEIRDAAQGATPMDYMRRSGCGGMIGASRPGIRG